ncbi:hypothetical protein D3C81_1172940 [compost metagenome]
MAGRVVCRTVVLRREAGQADRRVPNAKLVAGAVIPAYSGSNHGRGAAVDAVVRRGCLARRLWIDGAADCAWVLGDDDGAAAKRQSPHLVRPAVGLRRGHHGIGAVNGVVEPSAAGSRTRGVCAARSADLAEPFRRAATQPVIRPSAGGTEGACGAAGQSGGRAWDPGRRVDREGQRRAGANQGGSACSAADQPGFLQAGGAESRGREKIPPARHLRRRSPPARRDPRAG